MSGKIHPPGIGYKTHGRVTSFSLDCRADRARSNVQNRFIFNVVYLFYNFNIFEIFYKLTHLRRDLCPGHYILA
jgi:hypothetical protein